MVLEIDFKSGKPAHAQIVEQVQAAAASGALRPGEALPAVGPLALELRINRNAIARAYAELETLGVIESTPDRGYLLREKASRLHKDSRRRLLTVGGDTSSQPARRRSEAPIAVLAAGFLPGAVYVALIGSAGLALVLFDFVQGGARMVVAMTAAAAALLPLRAILSRIVTRVVSAQTERYSSAIEAIGTAASSSTDMEAFIATAVHQTQTATGEQLEWIRDYPTMASMVTSMPALRATRTPLSAASSWLMPIVSGEELEGLLRLSSNGGAERDSAASALLAVVAEHASHVANRLRLRREQQEGELAVEIQRGLLPREIPQAPGFSIAGVWQPARVVGGDYYDVFRLVDGKVAIALADVSGKGIPAALLMANLQATVKAYASGEHSPSTLCSRVNDAICSSVTPGRFITFFYAVLDPANRRLDYVNAGHNPPLVARTNGALARLETGGPILGVFSGIEYLQESVQLFPGDCLVVFTDGITEASDADGREFGEEGITSLLKNGVPGDATALRDAIMRDAAAFCRDGFTDDATLVAVTVDAAASASGA